MSTYSEKIVDDSIFFDPSFDVSHKNILTQMQQEDVRKETERFLDDLRKTFSQTYVHLDVQQNKEQLRNVRAFHWRVLLLTDNGRYHAENISFGAVESLKGAFNALENQIYHRLGRLSR